MKKTNTNPSNKKFYDNTHHKKNTIGKRDDLPDWFDIKKYEVAKDMQPEEWFIHLLVRQLIEVAYRDCCWPVFCLSYYDFGIDIQKDPFPHWEEVPGQMRKIIERSHPKAVEYSSVLGSYGVIRNVLSKEQYRYLRRWFTKHITVEKYLPAIDERPEWLTEKLNSVSHTILLDVNLKAPDQLILKQFKKIIQQERKKLAIDASKIIVNPKQLQAWYEFGVFPYCDLRNWARICKICILNRIYADAIFTHCEKGEETIRRTTRNLTNKLLTEEAMHQFYLQLELNNRHEK